MQKRSKGCVMLLSLLVVEGQRVVSTFHLNEVPATDMLGESEVLLDVLEKHLQFSSSIVLERKELRDRILRPSKSVSEYLAALQHQASSCAYGLVLEDRVAELFLEGLDSKQVQDCILRERVRSTVPTHYQIIGLARQFEQLSIMSEQFHQWPTSTP